MKYAPIAALLLLAACSGAAHTLAASEPADDAVCALDGMTLRDFPGPKAQIVSGDGKAVYFCNLMELFDVLFGEEDRGGGRASYVQDMGQADWDQPRGHWVEAGSAFYVLGSRAQGAMGPAIGAFARQQDAQAFAAREGGRVLAFGQLRLQMFKPRAIPAHGAHDDSMR